jgi:dolichol-phosphate mannosyltransferase
MQKPTVTIVVPTYKEFDSLPHLVDRVAKVRQDHGLDIEMLIMDDDSRDGSVELIAARPERWVRMIVRTQNRGLSQAVLAGLRSAQGDVLVCMDADLSHPPETLPVMLVKLSEGADFVLGSRYVQGGTTADDWGFLRWLNSRVATLLARPLTPVRDPMSGFFAIAKSTFENGRDFNPTGYKIALELIVKCGCERVVEVPINFQNRRFGESKLTFAQQLLYLQHLRRLYIFKYGMWTQLMQFLVVGAMGTLVNLAALTLLLLTGTNVRLAVALAIFVAMTFNFVLNRRFSFSFARHNSWLKQYAHFVAASSAAAVVNYCLTLVVLNYIPNLAPQVAALIGIVVGTGINFVASRYLVFRATHVRVDK